MFMQLLSIGISNATERDSANCRRSSMAEHLICNQVVARSSRAGGSKFSYLKKKIFSEKVGKIRVSSV